MNTINTTFSIRRVALLTTVAGLLLSLMPFAAHAQATRAGLQAEIEQLSALVEELAEMQEESIVCPYTWTRNLGKRDEGMDVFALQQFFNEDPDTQVAKNGNGSPGSESTYYGGRTAQAVKAFQEKYRTEILDTLDEKRGTGYFGELTRLKANELCAPAPDPDVHVEFISSDAVEHEGGPTGSTGEYTITFEVSAATDDIYVSSDIGEHMGYIEGVSGINPAGNRSGVLAATADEDFFDGYSMYRVDAGETETFTLTINYDPEADGLYRLVLAQFPYTLDPNGSHDEFNIEPPIETDELFLEREEPVCPDCEDPYPYDPATSGGLESGNVLGVDNSKASPSNEAVLEQLQVLMALVAQLQQILLEMKGVGTAVSDVAKEKDVGNKKDTDEEQVAAVIKKIEAKASEENVLYSGEKAFISGIGLSGPLTIKLGNIEPKYVETTGMSQSLAVFTVPEYTQAIDTSIRVINFSEEESNFYNVHILPVRDSEVTADLLIKLNDAIIVDKEDISFAEAEAECVVAYNDYDTYNFKADDVLECYWGEDLFEMIDGWKG